MVSSALLSIGFGYAIQRPHYITVSPKVHHHVGQRMHESLRNGFHHVLE
jgi:hypothetical protein